MTAKPPWRDRLPSGSLEAVPLRGTSILLLLLLALPAAAAPQSTYTREVVRPVTYPTPLGPITVLDDGHVWEVEVPEGAQVFVAAEGFYGSLFYLRTHGAASPSPPLVAAPTQEDGATLGPGTWRVVVDPAGGVFLHVDLTFTGRYGDLDGGAPAAFVLRDVKGGSPCVLPGVCLP